MKLALLLVMLLLTGCDKCWLANDPFTCMELRDAIKSKKEVGE